jgi:FixJ family two-component response regulator
LNHKDPKVFVVDDDDSIRKSLVRLIRSAGFQAETFSSADEFINQEAYEGLCCLILDVRMPGMSGLELQQKLNRMEVSLPIIFITGHGDVPMSVKAMKAGAIDFLPKPFNDQELLDIISRAFEKSKQIRKELLEISSIKKKINTLTPRQYEVFTLVVSGMLNKQIAYKLGISEKTVKVHRARVMEKMGVESLADLVRLAVRMGIPIQER